MKRLLAVALILMLGVSVASFAGKVAVVLDVGGRGDLSFNDQGFEGTDRAAREFGWGMQEVQNATGADYLPNLRNLARSGEYDLIICVGFLLGDALNAVAPEFRDQKFAGIDIDWVTGPNIANWVFRENESSALVGALAAMGAAYHGYAAAGVVLGIEIPVLWHFEAGFRYGMDWGLKKYASVMGSAPTVNLLYTYTGTFSDIALGKAASEAMLAQGAVGIYNVAGPLGIGDHEAVAEEHSNAGTNYGPPYYYGVDAFQDWFGAGKHTPVSALKRVDTACYEAVKAVVEGRFVAGLQSLGMSDGGVRLSMISDFEGYFQYGAANPKVSPEEYYATVANWALNRGTIPAWIWGAVAELEAGILNGTITVPTANTGAEIAAVRAQYTLGSP